MTVSLIAAMARNRVIGREGTLPWHLPEDLRRFKRLTMGHAVLLGRRTWESIGRALPGRTWIVVTRQAGYRAPGAAVAHSLAEGLAAATGDEAFVAGGATLYEQAMPLARRLHLTVLDRDFDGDTWFPEIDPGLVLQRVERIEATADIPFAYEFRTYERRLLSGEPVASPHDSL